MFLPFLVIENYQTALILLSVVSTFYHQKDIDLLRMP